jgi:hypothetical protein
MLLPNCSTRHRTSYKRQVSQSQLYSHSRLYTVWLLWSRQQPMRFVDFPRSPSTSEIAYIIIFTTQNIDQNDDAGRAIWYTYLYTRFRFNWILPFPHRSVNYSYTQAVAVNRIWLQSNCSRCLNWCVSIHTSWKANLTTYWGLAPALPITSVQPNKNLYIPRLCSR